MRPAQYLRRAGLCLALAPGVAIVILALPSGAHDSWISRNHYRDPATKEWCCNEQDCSRVSGDGIRVVPGGYLIVETGEVIPQSRALPSEDGEAWRCRYLGGPKRGQTRCFFSGLPGS